MLKSSWLIINLILGSICMVFAVILQLFEITSMASMFAAAMCVFIFLDVIPLSVSRIKPSLTLVHNLLIVTSAAFSTTLLLFLTTTFVYLGLFNAQMFTFFEVVFYPGTLAILLIEFIIAYLNKSRYVNSIEFKDIREDE